MSDCFSESIGFGGINEPELGDNQMRSHRTSTHARGRRRALITAFASVLVFFMGFGQAMLPASAGAPSLTMGQVPTGNGGNDASRQAAAPLAAASLAGGDVSLDFIAAGHTSYNHTTGVGGAYGARSIGPNGVEESLEGQDFTCGDKVVYFTAVTVDQGAGHGDIDLDLSWDGTTTSGSMVGINDLEIATLNAPDSGTKNLDGDETVSIQSETGPPPNGTDVQATVRVTNLDGGEQLIVRLVTHLWCDPNETHVTGNIHANLDSAKVVGGGNIPGGQQTVPLKQAGNILVPGLNVLKSCPASGSLGDEITYTITVQNTGQDTLNNIQVDDSILGSLSASFADSLAGGGSESHTFTYTLTANPDPITNVVTVTAMAAQSATQLSDTADCTTDVLTPGLEIEKKADAGSVNAGEKIGFTITVKNTGQGTAKNVVVTDTLPTNAGLTWTVDGGTGAAQCTITNGALSCTYATLASGASKTIHLTSPTTAATCGTVSNSAGATADNGGSVSAGPATIEVKCPDIVVDKKAKHDPVQAGHQAEFVITVSNEGTGLAKDVVLTDPLPAGLSWKTDDQRCTITNGILTCQLGDLAPGDSTVVEVRATTHAEDCGVIHNTATAGATNELVTVDQRVIALAQNNTSSADITILCPDVTVDKKADDDTVDAGDPVGFTITVTNSGDGRADDVTLEDVLPTNAGLDWTIDGGTGASDCSIDTGVLTCDFGDVPAKTTLTVHITSDTDFTTCGVIENTATVSVDHFPDVSDSDAITVICPPLGIDIEKDGPDLAHVGDTITYDFTVKLTTPEPLFDVTVTDPNCNEGAPVYVSGDDGDDALEPGEVWTYTCTHIVTANDLDPLPNTATVAGTADDGRTTTDEDSHDVDLIHPAILIVKTVNPDQGNPGDTVTYTYKVTNTGDTTLYDVSVDDDIIGHIGDIDELAVDETVTLTKDYVLPSSDLPIVNVGTATGTDVLGETVTDDDDASVTIVEASHGGPNPPPPTAFTGSDALRFGAIALALLGVGLVALVIGKRRRTT